MHNHIRTILTAVILTLLTAAFSHVEAQTGNSQCPTVEIHAERLPDMNMPRAGHAMFVCGDEVVVVGGHTTGFTLTKTAEVYSDGKWETLPTVYVHDNPVAIRLKSGKILVAGGHEKDLGIGQTFPAEIYDPTTRTFEGFGCLDKKRAIANAVELDNGKVVISGNWYAEDAIELFDGKKTFSFLKHVSQQRSAPYILQTAKDDAIIFSAQDTCGHVFSHVIADRVKGEPFHIPLMDKWKPLFMMKPINADDFLVGDKSKGNYTYILPVQDSIGHTALVKFQDGQFSLLPTTHPAPQAFRGDTIQYLTFIADRQAEKGYLMGMDSKCHWYALAVDYRQALSTGSPAPVTLYHTRPLTGIEPSMMAVELTGGNILLTGGAGTTNYKPFSAVYIMEMNGKESTKGTGWSVWTLILSTLGLILSVSVVLWMLKRKKREEYDVFTTNNDENNTTEPKDNPNKDNTLYGQICRLMESERPYLNPNFKLSDLAALLHTNSKYVSECIRRNESISFSQFVNNYRILYAKECLRKHPDAKISSLYAEAGFASEATFFRTFKLFTGYTPKEWAERNEE